MMPAKLPADDAMQDPNHHNLIAGLQRILENPSPLTLELVEVALGLTKDVFNQRMATAIRASSVELLGNPGFELVFFEPGLIEAKPKLHIVAPDRGVILWEAVGNEIEERFGPASFFRSKEHPGGEWLTYRSGERELDLTFDNQSGLGAKRLVGIVITG